MPSITKTFIRTLPSQQPIPFQHPLSILPKCNSTNQLHQIHAHMTTTGLIRIPSLASKLLVSFATAAVSPRIAHRIAAQIPGLDTFTWNTIIRAYLDQNNPQQAFSLYAHIRCQGLQVDSYTLLFATKAVPTLLGGQEIHAHIIKMGFLAEMITATSLIDMYGLFDSLDSAYKVFDETPHGARDLVLWNALLSLCAQKKYPLRALGVLRLMVKENVKPNGVTLVSVLSACACLKALRQGREVHGYVARNLLRFDVYIYNVLMDVYSRCGCLSNAFRLFEWMPVRNVVSWTTMINGCTKNNHPDKALELLKNMDRANIQLDEVTILGVISMCSKLGSLELGKWVCEYIEKNGTEDIDACLSNALMDMHAKCGNLEKACQLFNQLKGKTLVSWSTMIQGLAMHGHGIPALTRFCQMLREGFKPDGIVFSSVLSACSHAGLVEEGRTCFQSMIEEYDVRPELMHYGCMVDLLCRAGQADEALQFVENMPITPDVAMWRMLLGACRNQGKVDLANKIMNHLVDIEPENSGSYVLLSNLYANVGEWNYVEDVRTEMRVMGVSKQDPGCSSIEAN